MPRVPQPLGHIANSHPVRGQALVPGAHEYGHRYEVILTHLIKIDNYYYNEKLVRRHKPRWKS